MTKVIAMIPARMGSQRLKRKNLKELDGVPLIVRAIQKCQSAGCFDEVWVNSEDKEFEKIAQENGAFFHLRPEHLGNNSATSEEFIAEFLEIRDCTHLLQVHSIAPLLTAKEVEGFTNAFKNSEYDVMLSCIHDQIEVAYNNNPVNFTFSEKTNSQDLKPVQRITWSITGWKKSTYLANPPKGACSTYSGNIGFYEVSPVSGHVIKTQLDLDVAEALLKVTNS